MYMSVELCDQTVAYTLRYNYVLHVTWFYCSSVSFWFSLSLFLLILSQLWPCLSISIFLSVFLCLSVSLSVSFVISFSSGLYVSPYLCVSLSVCLSFCICMYVSLSAYALYINNINGSNNSIFYCLLLHRVQTYSITSISAYLVKEQIFLLGYI